MITLTRSMLAATIAVALGFICGPTPARKLQTGTNEKVLPLRFRVIVAHPSVCVKAKIDLEVELQNTSGKPVLIDPKGLLYQLNFDSDNGGFALTNDPGPNSKPGPYLMLAPGESYRKETPYSLDDPFFGSPRLYKLKLTYGQFAAASATSQELYRGSVESNVVLFELTDCQ